MGCIGSIFGGLQLVFRCYHLLMVTYAVGITLGSLMGYIGGTFDILASDLLDPCECAFLYVVIIIADRIGRMTSPRTFCSCYAFSWIQITIICERQRTKKRREIIAAARAWMGPGDF